MPPDVAAVPATPVLTNWAGNVTFSASAVHRPSTRAELRAIVVGSRRLRVLGTGHSFNRIADTTGDLVATAGLPHEIELDSTARLVRVSGGVRYGELGPVLRRGGLALRNTGSLPHISVAGACSTGTHGSGVGNATLSASVRALTVLTAAGDLVTLDRETVGDDFDGCVLTFGRLGVVLELTLELVPDYLVAQTVVEDVPDSRLGPELIGIQSAAYSVSVFTPWGPGRRSQVWLREIVDRDGRWAGPDAPTWGGRLADGPRHPVLGMPTVHATEQLGTPGPWNERLPTFRLEFTPSSGQEIQSEYLLPLPQAPQAWSALDAVRERIRSALIVGEIRAVAADPLWLSPTAGRDCVAFHFTWGPDADAARTAAAEVEAALAPFDARPHWGKVFTTTDDELAARYPRMADQRRLIRQHDPGGVFGNELTDGWLGLR